MIQFTWFKHQRHRAAWFPMLVALLCIGSPLAAAETAPGVRHDVEAGAMPAPNTTKPADIDASFVPRPKGTLPSVPKGFAIAPFASSGLKHVRALTTAPNGDVFLAEQGPGLITLLRDSDGDGKADLITTFAKGFSQPYGIAMHDGAVYVADLRAVWRLPYHTGALKPTGPAQRITAAPDLRPDGWHTTRDIVFDRKGQLFLAIGSRGDVLEAPPPDATVQLVLPDGTMRTFASGLRNPAGMAIQPETGDLWVTVNERDKLGGALPPDFLTRVQRGDFFGWPYAYAGPHPDPVFGSKRPDLVARTKTPDVLLEAHSAPLGVIFYNGTQFPAAYRGDAFVALHGSGPYGAPDGYKVVRVHFAGGRPVGGYEDFVTGFSNDKAGDLQVWGTPCGLAIAKDGSLLIGDDKGRTIWRVSYIGN